MIRPPYLVALATALLLVALPAAPAGAQRLERDGFWIGFGLGPGYAFFDCDRCGPPVPPEWLGLVDPEADDVWEGGPGPSFYLTMGGAARQDLLLGGMLEGWGREDDPLSATMGSLSFIVQWYPMRGEGLYVRPGLGVGGARVESTGLELETSGMVGSMALGHDVRIGRRFALSPHIAYFQSFAEGTSISMGSRTGPDFPSYVSFSLGFHWY